MFRNQQLPERFWNKVLINNETLCWEWIGSINDRGYTEENTYWNPGTGKSGKFRECRQCKRQLNAKYGIKS